MLRVMRDLGDMLRFDIMRLSRVFIIILFLITIYWLFLGPVGKSDKQEVFVIPKNQKEFKIAKTLKEKKLIKNTQVFGLLFNISGKKVLSGGYRLNMGMNVLQILSKVTGKPDLVWVTLSGCIRKEQVGEILAKELDWTAEELNKWNAVITNDKPEYKEGVYYPDTYLIPVDETGEQIAQLLINRFNEKFAPYADKYLAANIKWTTGLKIASLIAREAAGKQDMKLISGIIWNRLDKGMPLQIDATMQYTLGKDKTGKWWGTIDINEKQSDSPYNSYLYKGLPPTPICNPSIDYIEAGLNPEETTCLYYLHDHNKQIHCSETYKEHIANIREYLD